MSSEVLKFRDFPSQVRPRDAVIGLDRPLVKLRPRKRVVRVADFRVSHVVRIAFFAFMASIPFETVDIGIPVEPTAITMGFLFLSLIFQPTLVLRKPPLAFKLFFLYVISFAVPVVFFTPSAYVAEAAWQLLILVQLFVMGWTVFNILKSERTARTGLITLAVACGILALLQQLGVSGKSVDESAGVERVSALGFHANNVARLLSVGFLALAGLTYATQKSLFKSRLWIFALLGLIGFTIVQTGSRGGLLALVAGLLVFMLKDGAVSTRIRNMAVAAIGVIFIIALVYQSDLNRSRFESAVGEGDLARREQIYPEAWRMFKQKPIFGWGPRTGEYELGARLAHVNEDTKNAHNLVLFALIATGLVGTIPLLAGLGLTFLAAWKNRSGLRGVLPLSLVVMVFVANMSGVWLHNKLHWFVMAYALSTPFVTRRLKRAGRSLQQHNAQHASA